MSGLVTGTGAVLAVSPVMLSYTKHMLVKPLCLIYLMGRPVLRHE